MKDDVRPVRPKPRRLTTANQQRVAVMVDKGIPPAAIAKHFGVPVSVIVKLAARE